MSESTPPESASRVAVEFSLDNRQVCFLFFGLAVVGSFVFGLGMLTGSRLSSGDAAQQVAQAGLVGDPVVASAAAANGEGAAKDEAQPVDAASELSFRDGIDQPLAAAIPATRAADQPPAHDVEVDRNVDASAAQVAKAAASQKSSKPRSKVSAAPKTQAAPAGKFTLVIKTTTSENEANQLASQLKSKGHAARVEKVTVKGKAGFRVRVGAFGDWDSGLAAKVKFEKAENRIAWLTSAQSAK